MGLSKLNEEVYTDKKNLKATREGFGEAILEAAKLDKKIYAVTADLALSTGLQEFMKEFPERFIDVGVAEQNLVTFASGLAHAGKIPFATSFAAFSPGRNWEQIRTTICYNNQPVKIIGSHTGLGVGEDGATHQALEDVALMRTLPNIEVIVPCDFEQAKKATLAIAKSGKPAYLRLHRQKTPIITTPKTDFTIGKAQIFKEGKDITIIASGPIMFEVMLAAKELEKKNINATIINLHTIKPLDKNTITHYAKKTKRILTIEDHQVSGGMGSAIAELLAEEQPTIMKLMGVKDKFGQSGHEKELYKKYGLTHNDIFKTAKELLRKKA